MTISRLISTALTLHLLLRFACAFTKTTFQLSTSASHNNLQTRRNEDSSMRLAAILDDQLITRRDWGVGSVISFASILLPSFNAGAAETTAIATQAVEMKLFVDPKGLFVINFPKGFFSVRRTSQGDLPDEKTGKGRRGSSIFTAGDLGKAEVIAVERFPTRVLLEENGIAAKGDLSSFPALGESLAVANLINLRREKDKPGMSNSKIFPDSVSISDDKKEIKFTIKSEIDVQKPELLMETYGITQLFRITTAKASLRSNDGNIMAVFASALEQDFNGPDGQALQEAVNSFQATDQSAK